MKKLLFSTAALIFFVALFAGVAMSQPDPGDRHPMKEKIKEKLKLTDEQESKIEALKSEHRKKMIDLKADLEKAKVDAEAIRGKDKITRAEAVAAVENISKIKNEMALAAVNHRMDIYEILTPEQRKVWKKFREDHPGMGMMEKREGHGKKFNRHMDDE